MKLIYILIFLTIFPILGFGQEITLVTPLDDSINETSGLIYLNNKLITHNDSSGANALYELDSISGNITRTVIIDNATNIDWEDLSYDDNYIYIADFGNNSGSRIDLKVYRISILDFFTTTTDRVTAEIIEFSYLDQTDFSPPAESTNFDAEALISYNGSLYIFTKNWGNYETNIYALPKIPGTYQIEKIGNIDSQGLVTGATYNYRTNTILLTGYNLNSFIPYSIIIEISDFTSDDFSDGAINRYQITIPNGYSMQIESITAFDCGQYYITSERSSNSFLTLTSGLYRLKTETICVESTDKYRLMFNSNPSTEITIGWNQISGTGQKVYYGTTDYGTNWSSYPNNSAPYRSVDYLGMNNQFVKLTGLIPDTAYYFVIKDSEGISERFWFRTISDDNNARLSIISGGDSRYDTSSDEFDEPVDRGYRQNSNKMVAKLRPHVVLFGGDLIGSPGQEPDTMAKWLDDWQFTITSDNQIIPVVHSYGNHEYDKTDGGPFILYDLFDVPIESYYNLKFSGDLFSFYVLNGELLPLGMENDDTKRVEQINWLHNQLPADNSIWKSAGYHRPISPHNSDKVPQKDSFNDWANLFYDYGVRIVMESDAHLVKLTKELKPASATAVSDDPENWFEMSNIEPDKGITFIGGGSWSIIREDNVSYTYTLAKGSFYSFNWIFVDQNAIEIRTLDTQSPNTITDRTESTRFDINSDVGDVTWKPSGLPSGVIIISKCSNCTIWDNGWSNGVPNASTNTFINADYNHQDANIETNDLTINSSLNFDNGTTNSVVVHGNLTINGIFTIGDTESLVMYDDDAIIEGNIIKYEESTSRNNTHDMTYWSPPVSDAIIESVFTGVTPTRIFYYDQMATEASDPAPENDPDGTYWDTWKIASGTMEKGIGYAAEGITGSTDIHNIEFKGVPNNGLVQFDLNHQPGDDLDNDFNLIGNPYPSAIDVIRFFDGNNNIDPTIYFWTHTEPISEGDSGDYSSSDYAERNRSGGTGVAPGEDPDGYIGSGQGFFVRASNGGSVNFTNFMRTHDIDANYQFFKSDNNKINEEKDRIWLNLTTDKGGFNQLLVAFMEEATQGVDSGYDATELNGDNVLSFYSHIDNGKYVIQGLGSFSTNKTIDLGFDISVAPRILTISIDKTEGVLKDTNIFLVDNILNVTHDLKKSDYKFDQTITGENLNRFTLQFTGQALGIEEFNNDNSFIISNTHDGFKIHANRVVDKIKVYDMLGRLLLQNNPNKQSFNLSTEHIKDGTILIVELFFDNNLNLSKRIIKF